ncbi:MAG: hypothetical protein L0229_31615, partial [Blastocatellia bacterium]|nr:hypothetical protein [Blastocatellia bacterium]
NASTVCSGICKQSSRRELYQICPSSVVRQRSVVAGEQGGVVAGEQGSRGARERGSRGAGEP